MPVTFSGGLPVFAGNSVIEKTAKDGPYHVSYLPSKRNYGVETTTISITIGNNERRLFYILKGDHREELGCCQTLKECIQYYQENQSLIHPYSDPFEHHYLLEENNTDKE